MVTARSDFTLAKSLSIQAFWSSSSVGGPMVELWLQVSGFAWS